jgi:Xaa-Pro aminopeptidase
MIYSDRVERFRRTLDTSADMAFFPVSADLQYLTGVPRDIPTYGAILYPGGWVEGLWMARDTEPVLLLTRMTAEFHAPDTSNLDVRVLSDQDDPTALLKSVFDYFSVNDLDRLAVGDTTNADTIIHLQQIYPKARFISATEMLRPQRMIKSQPEIDMMRRAGEITEAAFADVVPRLKHGMSELDIISEVDYALRRHGALGPSFTTSLYTAGPAHALVFGQHTGSWHRKLRPPVSILFDFGAIYEGYCYDFGRTVVFGEPDEQVYQIHSLVMLSQAAGITAMRVPEVTAADVDAAARRVIEEAGLGETFRHRLGHGIGLDVHEPPFLTGSDCTVLEKGMLFTVEPSILFEKGLSARVEDVVLVGDDGGVPLTVGFQDLIVID